MRIRPNRSRIRWNLVNLLPARLVAVVELGGDGAEDIISLLEMVANASSRRWTLKPLGTIESMIRAASLSPHCHDLAVIRYVFEERASHRRIGDLGRLLLERGVRCLQHARRALIAGCL
jgi:hypothetical protein